MKIKICSSPFCEDTLDDFGYVTGKGTVLHQNSTVPCLVIRQILLCR